MLLWHVYIRKDVAIIPTVGQTEAGFYMDIEPVYSGPASDVDALQLALKEAIRTGNPKLPTPPRRAFPRPVVLDHAKVKTWKAFENGTALWTIVKKDAGYVIKRGRELPSGGWEDDPRGIESLPLDASVDDVAKRVADRIRDYRY
jgi:hypothetical protein